MAGQAGKWRYGLLPLVALWLGVNTLETSRIEAELGDRAQRALDAAGAAGVQFQVEGRDIRLKGEIADAARAAALAGVETAGARVVADSLKAAPARGGQGSEHASEHAAAPAPQADSAKPAPKPAAQSPPVAEPRPEKASSGEDQAAKTPPVAAPYVFQAEKIGGKVALSGFYPDAETHAKIVAAAAKAFAGRELLDQLKPGGGAPYGFLDAALAGLGQLARLRSGALDLRDHVVRLSGEARKLDVADIRSRLAGALPGGFSAIVEFSGAREIESVKGPPREAPAPKPASPSSDARACQARMAAVIKGDPVTFALGSARLAPDSARVLDAVAAEAKRCPDVGFEIAGHTDDIGVVSENLELSRRRAEAVLVYLVAVGVAPQRLTAVGYGETRPLVANANDDDRAKNRRIEFNLK